MRMRQRLFLAFAAILALLSPSLAFEVQKGECQRILSGQARVRIHYASGVKAEVDPVDRDNITSQVDVFPDGRKVPQKWIGGLLPLDGPAGRFAYAHNGGINLLLEVGETRQFPFTYTWPGGQMASGTIAVVVERVEKAAFGECQATFVTVALTNNWNGARAPRSTSIARLFVKEIGFFLASTVESVKDGKRELVTFRATRVELIR
jgi:hypothetical protein